MKPWRIITVFLLLLLGFDAFAVSHAPKNASTGFFGVSVSRARYYNPQVGRFWTMDSFEGNRQDPLSLHKYLYCQADPVNRIDPSGHTSFLSLSIGMGFRIALASAVVVGTSYALYRTRTLTAATEHYTGSVLQLRLSPVVLKDSVHRHEYYDGIKERLPSEVKTASEFWKRWAGIEIVLDEIRFISGDSDNLKVGPSNVESAVAKYYSGTPVLLGVEDLDTPDTAGLTAINSRNGFVIPIGGFGGGTIAHELGHVLIPKMFTHSVFATHVAGNPANLMSSGMAREAAGFDLEDLFLTQTQVNEARKTVNARGWAK